MHGVNSKYFLKLVVEAGIPWVVGVRPRVGVPAHAALQRHRATNAVGPY